jgi:hypothetical protein
MGGTEKPPELWAGVIKLDAFTTVCIIGGGDGFRVNKDIPKESRVRDIRCAQFCRGTLSRHIILETFYKHKHFLICIGIYAEIYYAGEAKNVLYRSTDLDHYYSADQESGSACGAEEPLR